MTIAPTLVGDLGRLGAAAEFGESPPRTRGCTPSWPPGRDPSVGVDSEAAVVRDRGLASVREEWSSGTENLDRAERRRRLARFGVVCLVLSWVPLAALGLLGADISDGVPQLVFGLAASGPSLAMVAMWLVERSGRVRLPIVASWTWPLAALVLGAGPVGVTALIANSADVASIGQHATSVVVGVGGPLAVIGYTLIAGPLSEEYGWRGYVQPLLRQRLGGVTTALAVGSMWGLWHVPLFFLNGTGQHAMGLFSVQAALFFIALIPLSYTALFVSEHLRGGTLAAVLIHAAYNASSALLPPLDDRGAWLKAGLILVSAAIVALWWRPRRPDARTRRSGPISTTPAASWTRD